MCGPAALRTLGLTRSASAEELKLAYYVRLVTSIVAWGNEAWKLDKKAQQKLNGFNSRCISVITSKTAREEASKTTQTMDIVGIFKY